MGTGTGDPRRASVRQVPRPVGGRAPGAPPATGGPARTAVAPRWGIASFPAIGTTARVLVTQAPAARRRGGGGQRPARAAGRHGLPVPRRLRGRRAGHREADAGAAAAARTSWRRRCGRPGSPGGAVDPTVGGSLAALGYDRDFTAVPADSARGRWWSGGRPAGGRSRSTPPPGPSGCRRAWCSTSARPPRRTRPTGRPRDAAATAGCGVLVSLGGDVAVAGAGPPAAGPSGWPTTPPPPTRTCRRCGSAPGGWPTSSNRGRGAGAAAGSGLHHIVDPVTGLPADTPWRTVSVAAASCLDAQIAATATMVPRAGLAGADRDAGPAGGHRRDRPHRRGVAGSDRRGALAGLPRPPGRRAGAAHRTRWCSAPSRPRRPGRGPGRAGPGRRCTATWRLLSIGALAVHIGAVVLDSTSTSAGTLALVPFVSAYRPVSVGAGTVAFDLVLVVIATSLLRVRLGVRTWRAVHWLTYAAWPVAVLHYLTTGTDAARPGAWRWRCWPSAPSPSPSRSGIRTASSARDGAARAA